MASGEKIQTTLRVDRELLCKVRMILNMHGFSVTQYLTQKMAEVLEEPEKALASLQHAEDVVHADVE